MIPRISDEIIYRLTIKFGGVLYRKLASKHGFRENRLSGNYALLKGAN